MFHTRLSLTALIIAAIVVAGFALSVPHAREVAEPTDTSSAPAPRPTVSLRDAYAKGVHTISGSVVVPDACTALSAAAVVEGEASTSESIVVALTVPEDAEVCLEIPTKRSFSVSAKAPEGAPVRATINGAAASTTES